METRAHNLAVMSRERLLRHDMRELIVCTMMGIGDFDMWMDVYRDAADMLQRFRDNKHKIKQREPLLVDLKV